MDKNQILLNLCCRQFIYKNALPEINTMLNENEFDWDLLMFMALKQSIPSIYHVLVFNRVKNIPEEAIAKIQAVQQQLIKRNKSLIHELFRLNKTFKEKGLPAIPYKGLVLAKQFYHNVIQRVSVDIDFSLDVDKFYQAKEIMLELGYEEFKSKVTEDAIEKSRAYYLDYPFLLKNGDQIIFNVEFHWTPSHHVLNIPIQFTEFQDKTEILEFGPHRVKTFDKVHQALFAIIHHGNVDCWGKLKHLVDFGIILNELDATELAELEKLCKHYKIYKSFEKGKALLGQLFDVKEYQNLKVSNRWANDLVIGKMVGNWVDNKMKFYYFVSSRDSFSEMIRSGFSLIKYHFYIKPKLDGPD